MKRFAVFAGCVLATVLSVSPAATAERAGASVLCWNRDFPPPTGNQDPAVKRMPRRCTFFKRNKSTLAQAIQATDLRWRGWGSDLARGKGKVTAAMGAGARLSVRLSRPVTRCGHRVFSRATFRIPDFGPGRTAMRLWTC